MNSDVDLIPIDAIPEERAIDALVQASQPTEMEYARMTTAELQRLLRDNYFEAHRAGVITFLIRAIRRLGATQQGSGSPALTYTHDSTLSLRASFDPSTGRLEIVCNGHNVCSNVEPGHERFVKGKRWLYHLADAYRVSVAQGEAAAALSEQLASDRLITDLTADV
jgi:hypothetical protein